MENVYDMGKVFRNEGISPKHSPEFTIIEFMCAYSDYNDVATVTEEMFRDVAQAALGRTTIKRNGEEIDLAKPWRRVTMRELILERFGLDFMESTREQLAEVLDEPIDPAATWAEVVADIYSEKIESTINQPTHVFDFPLEPFPITKRHAVHPELAEHFDAVIGGIELVSGDTELNDPVDEWQRFVDQRKRRAIDDGDVPHPNDEEYTRALEYGYSPTAGGGMGVDRLVMILTERDTLREVIPFPIVKEHPMSGRRHEAPSKLDLDPGVIASCRAGGERRSPRRSARRSPARRPSRSSARSRACSAWTASNELDAPLPNVLVDHVHDRGELGRGHRLLAGQRAARRRAPLAAADRRGRRRGASSTCARCRARRTARSGRGSRSECERAARARSRARMQRAPRAARAPRREPAAAALRADGDGQRLRGRRPRPRRSRRPAATSSR